MVFAICSLENLHDTSRILLIIMNKLEGKYE